MTIDVGVEMTLEVIGAGMGECRGCGYWPVLGGPPLAFFFCDSGPPLAWGVCNRTVESVGRVVEAGGVHQ